MKTTHSGDCTFYASVINGEVTDGICTCGYGWEVYSRGDGDRSQLVSEERQKHTDHIRADSLREAAEIARRHFEHLPRSLQSEAIRDAILAKVKELEP